MVQLPERFAQRMKELLGEEYPAFEKSFEETPLQGLRLNSLKQEGGKEPDWERTAPQAAAGLARLGGFTLTKVPWVKEGFYYGAGERPGKHPFHEAGVYYIQEPSAMAVGELLDPRPGERILDLCAAPGGKSSQIASRLKGEGFLLSNEIHPARASVLSQNMERMGAVNCVVSNEEPARLAARFPEWFDGIVVDAPCSGEGMFRKDEEALRQWTEELTALCAARQDGILDCAAKMTRPGGRIVYSTCTFAPEEDEGAILRFLQRHEEFFLEEPLPCEGLLPGRPEWALFALKEEERSGISQTELEELHLERTRRLMPHRVKGEGHFAAVLRRRGEVPESAAVRGTGLREPVYLDRKKEKESWRLIETFLKDSLTDPASFTERREYVRFGDQVYLVPPQMPDMKGMKILRPGLHLGTIKKNRFEPSQALAQALRPGEAYARCSLRCGMAETERYLRGETLAASPEWLSGTKKGWVLVCVDGFSLGWAKLAGGVLKNHYPRGLRWM